MLRYEHFRVVEVLQDIHDTAAIPVVSDTAPIVDLPCCVLEDLWGGWVRAHTNAQPPAPRLPLAYLVGDVIILIQEHLELADADAQVPIRELIGDVEAQGPKLSALQCIPVEQAQREQQGFELCHLQEVEGSRLEG